MTKQQIIDSELYKVISSASPLQRYDYLIGGNQTENIKRAWNATIKEWPMSALSAVTEDQIALSILPYDKMSIAIITPLDSQ